MNVPGRPALRHKQNEQVSCGVCKEVLRYDGLPRHFKRKHKDSDPFVYGEDSSKKQKTLSGFLFSNSKASQQTDRISIHILIKICSRKSMTH